MTGLWGGPKTQFMPHGSLRSAQEVGINLLHLAWQRRQEAMAPPSSPKPPPPLS
jgi:hypothetical protein